MKLKYYSWYPWKAEDYKRVTIPPKGNDDYERTMLDMPFRLYLAATCEGESRSISEFISDCYEAMDRPDARFEWVPSKGAYLDTTYNVLVTPTKHFYGATNSYDGIYEINNLYYATGWEGTKCFSDLKSAILFVARYQHQSEMFLKGIDYTLFK